MASDDFVMLCCDAIEVVLSPRVGGAIARFDWSDSKQRVPVLRGADGVPARSLDAGCFPLVPFSNRIRGGRLTFRGREIILQPNMAGDPSPLHGQGWLAAWNVASANVNAADLIFRHAAGEWPWAYEARQQLRVDPGGLSVTLSCRNLSDEPMPCGLGLHPYFHCSPQTRIDAGVTHAWTIDDKVLPVQKVPAEGRYDLSDRSVCGQDLDNGFGGWDARAAITDPALPFTIELSSPDARFFQLYSPRSGGLFVAEPVTHANAALNEPEERWPELGLKVLEPGEEMLLHARIGLTPVADSVSPRFAAAGR